MIKDDIGHQTIEYNGKIIFVSIDYDECATHPLNDWGCMGKILSLGHRHANYAPDEIKRLIEEQPENVVPLSYFEHGNCVWSVRGTIGNYPDFRWDGISFAGIWVADEDTIKEADEKTTKEERREFLVRRAQEACDIYTQYCNGDVYAISIRAYEPVRNLHGNVVKQLCVYREMAEPIYQDSVGEVYGYKGIRDIVKELEIEMVKACDKGTV